MPSHIPCVAGCQNGRVGAVDLGPLPIPPPPANALHNHIHPIYVHATPCCACMQGRSSVFFSLSLMSPPPHTQTALQQSASTAGVTPLEPARPRGLRARSQ